MKYPEIQPQEIGYAANYEEKKRKQIIAEVK